MLRFDAVFDLCVRVFRGDVVRVDVERIVLEIERVAEEPPTWKCTLDGVGICSGDAFEVVAELVEVEDRLKRNASRRMPALRAAPTRRTK